MKQAPCYDVAVVGGGPSGSTAAFILASHGFKVSLLDKMDFPRPKLCAGLLTWKTINLLERVFGCSSQTLTEKGIINHSCRDYRVYIRQDEIIRRRLDFPFHFVERTRYDTFWLRLAQKAGCHILTGQPVTQVDPISGQVELADGMHLKAGIIIGADGVWSKVRQSIQAGKASHKKWRRYLAATIETLPPCAPRAPEMDYAAIYFGYLPWGYAWSFPGKNRQVIGIGGLHRRGSPPMSQYFRNFLDNAQIKDDHRPTWHSYPLPYGNYLQNPARGRALLVGDACGLADPLLGEGIYYAHLSGKLAANAIISTGLDTAGAANRYRKALNNHVLKELRWINLYRNLLFVGGKIRRFRGMRLFFHLMPKRMEAAVHGQIPLSRLLWPRP